mmetsp:Transcript_74179/g.224860  ORF Transcript_74179/g.224860 Transcript_74179/m.224860 type:complete len:271 (+) Transcript_74179:60-872(+)
MFHTSAAACPPGPAQGRSSNARGHAAGPSPPQRARASAAAALVLPSRSLRRSAIAATAASRTCPGSGSGPGSGRDGRGLSTSRKGRCSSASQKSGVSMPSKLAPFSSSTSSPASRPASCAQEARLTLATRKGPGGTELKARPSLCTSGPATNSATLACWAPPAADLLPRPPGRRLPPDCASGPGRTRGRTPRAVRRMSALRSPRHSTATCEAHTLPDLARQAKASSAARRTSMASPSLVQSARAAITRGSSCGAKRARALTATSLTSADS